jgi:hypothetical protein
MTLQIADWLRVNDHQKGERLDVSPPMPWQVCPDRRVIGRLTSLRSLAQIPLEVNRTEMRERIQNTTAANLILSAIQQPDFFQQRRLELLQQFRIIHFALVLIDDIKHVHNLIDVRSDAGQVDCQSVVVQRVRQSIQQALCVCCETHRRP